MSDKLHEWEKWPLRFAVGAQAVYVFRWYLLDAPIPEFVGYLLPWLQVAGGVAAAVAIEGALIATVMGVRMGRRGRASYAALCVAGVFSAAVALSLYGAISVEVSRWLHMAFSLTTVAYLLHLVQPITPREDVAPQAEREPIEIRRIVLPRQIADEAEAEPQPSLRQQAAALGVAPSTLSRRMKRLQSEGEA